MSFWLIAIVAATSAVMPPIQAIASLAHPAWSSTGLRRTSR